MAAFELAIGMIAVLAVVLIYYWSSSGSGGNGGCHSTVSALGGRRFGPANRVYSLYTDLSCGKLKPGTAANSMLFYVGGDPTDGTVNYGAWDTQVTVAADGKTTIAAGPVVGGRRNMVRLRSAQTYDSGLFVLSASHIPAGLGTWPSFWLTSATGTWACNGEIDIIEGVNSVDQNSSRNASTLHTSDKPGAAPCRQLGVRGISNDGDCTAPSNSNGGTCGCDSKSGCPFNGCGVTSVSPTTFGKGFNDNGGGTYACELTPEGAITIWFFQAGEEPNDLLADNPDPSTWPITSTTVKFTPCPGQFKDMEVVLNTTLCGQWSGNVYPGGWAKCNTDVTANPTMPDAYWGINYLKVYVKTSELGVAVKPAPPQWARSPPLR
jgi:hypothetical protein